MGLHNIECTHPKLGIYISNPYTNMDENLHLHRVVNKFQNFIYTYKEGMSKIIYTPKNNIFFKILNYF